MWDAVRSIVGTVAPALGTALGGPLGGLAASQLTQWLGLSPKASPGEIAERLKGLPPEQLVELTKIEKEFEIQVQELALKGYQTEVEDREGARRRELDILQLATATDWTKKLISLTPTILAFLTTTLLSLFTYLLFHEDIPPDNFDVLKYAFVQMDGVWLAIMTFYFGSSRSSRLKDDILSTTLATLVKQTQPAANQPSRASAGTTGLPDPFK